MKTLRKVAAFTPPRGTWKATTALVTSIVLSLPSAANASEGGQPDGMAALPQAGTQASAPESANSTDIIVTGSRAAAAGFSAPSAVSVIGADIVDQQSPISIAEVLQQEPAFKATRSVGGNANNFASPGQATADLRGLGGQRTLVLVDGSRVVPQASSVTTGSPVATDLNVIPTNMIERVEVVTGGASAQYGSDAVAGVVNILLKKKMTGIELSAQTGISQQGDNFRYKLGAVGGLSFGDGRGNIVVAVEKARSDEIQDIYRRDWGRREEMIVTNRAYLTNGLPANIVADGVRNSNSIGGRIIGPANFSLRNYTFNDDGTIRPYQVGSVDDGTNQIGGEGLSRSKGSSLIPGIERFVVHALSSFEVSPALNITLSGGYSETLGLFTGGLPNFASFTIRNDNAFLPQAVKNAMAAQGLTSITVAKGVYDVGNINFRVKNKTPHGTIGVEGDLGNSWHYDAHYSYGENQFRSDFSNNFSPAFWNLAVDAVAAPGGGIVCRSTLAGQPANPLAAGCVPVNIFGPNAVSTQTPAALAYVNRSDYHEVIYKQHAASINMRGEPFSTWAAPVAVAFGGEYRQESQVLTAGPLATAGRFAIGNVAPFSGKFNVKEGYVEAIVPLARDLSFARNLDLNGAIRYADYSTAGGQTTWKVGGVYEPIQGLRFRVTRSKDIRAAAIYELFSPGSFVNVPLTVNGVTAVIPQNRTVGNPDLRPEKADTLTLGVVVQPSSLPGLRMSLDYYLIDLKDAIDSITAANIGNACSAGDAQACSYITFSGATPTRLVAPVQNISQFKTSGLDMALSYQVSLGGGVSMSTRFTGTYALRSYINGIDRSGENGMGSLGSQPRFRGNLTQTFSTDAVSLSAQLLYISKGKNDNQFDTIPALTINENDIPAAAYVNLFSTIRVAGNFELSASVSNLLDKDPPSSPYATQSQPVNGQLYDKIGRVFEVGAKVRF
ncbi:outer membrane receptor protein involved in Fe transport [Sphingobium sp. B2D3C]|uniref:TonB-dependent receptor domain-containing protein n=1 Tax=Sphingobium sp. B2D3B TaxID=2940580 RepID=UPI002225B381|nr:TonB-dependent receptor [Sphingobium sp. B2D3B]MCW2399026.1 outer membrane receptor protein involved in Fe transport [Sphingobium sp. B2D3C]